MYYGTYALRDAMNTAQSGDVINLSCGGFQAVDIKKAVSLRGTGIEEADPTIIIGDYSIDMEEDDTNRFSMEGIICKGLNGITVHRISANPYFIKSLFHGIFFDCELKNALFVNCKITYGNNSSYTATLREKGSAHFVNCYIGAGFRNLSNLSSVSFINCVLGYYYPGTQLNNCQLINCILFSAATENVRTLPNTTIASNCVAVNDNREMSQLFDNMQTNSNCKFSTFADMFKNFTGRYSDTQTYELTDTAKENFLGTDGTEVGMYGGLLPYDSPPPTLRLRR